MSPANRQPLFPENLLPPVIQTGPVASTNSYVQELLHRGVSAPDFSVWQTGHQTAGRGQGDHLWESAPGSNITLSIVLHPGFLPVKQQFMLSQTIALAVRDLVAAIVSDVTVKWPNDIYAGDRKIAGILIENLLKGRCMDTTIAGIGLNVNQVVFESDAPNPVSLRMLTNTIHDLPELVRRLQQSVAARFSTLRRLVEQNDLSSLQKEYLHHMYRFGTWHRYCTDAGQEEGRITGVTLQGHLCMEFRDRSVRQFDLKEVRFLP